MLYILINHFTNQDVNRKKEEHDLCCAWLWLYRMESEQGGISGLEFEFVFLEKKLSQVIMSFDVFVYSCTKLGQVEIRILEFEFVFEAIVPKYNTS